MAVRQQSKNLAEIAFALSSPTRVDILKMINQKGRASNKDLAFSLNMHPANISQHLKILRHSRLITEMSRLKDNTILLEIDKNTIDQYSASIALLSNKPQI